MQSRCPMCKKMIEYSVDNPYRPFCSERCQILDLGAWADEKYAVPVTSDQELSSVNEEDEEKIAEHDPSSKH